MTHGDNVKQWEFSFAIGDNEKWYSHLENTGQFLNKTKHTLTIQLRNCNLWYLPKGVKNLHTDIFIEILLKIVKTSKRPSCPSGYDWINTLIYI